MVSQQIHELRNRGAFLSGLQSRKRFVRQRHREQRLLGVATVFSARMPEALDKAHAKVRPICDKIAIECRMEPPDL